MKRLAIAMLAVLAAGPTMAAECEGRADLFDLIGWQAEDQSWGTEIRLGLHFRGDRAIEMIDATIAATDPLDGVIVAGEMTRDTPIEPGARVSTGLSVPSTPRLTLLDQTKVTWTVCVHGLLYADGGVEKF